MLDFIAGLCGYIMSYICLIVENYGLAIIVFTIFFKLLLIPLTNKQERSMEQAQKMQSIMTDLQKKYANDQQKMIEEYQKALQENNMSMLSGTGCSGCLIQLIQLPILLGMFYMMVSPLTHIMKMPQEEILKYKEEIINTRKEQAIEQLYAISGDKLSSGDLLLEEEKIRSGEDYLYVDQRYYEIDIIKEKELMDLEFLGINLGDVASKNKDNKALVIIPLLSMTFTYISLMINNAINKKKGIQQPKPEDMEVPMPDMRVMNIMMPLMLGYVAYSIPQGVGLYWALSNFIGIIQTVVRRIVLDPDRKKEEKKLLVENNEVKNVEYQVIDDLSEVKEEITPVKTKNNSNNNKNHNNNKNKGKNKKKK